MSTRRFRMKLLASITAVACLGLAATVSVPGDARAQTGSGDIQAEAAQTSVPPSITQAVETENIRAFRVAALAWVTAGSTDHERAVRYAALSNWLSQYFMAPDREDYRTFAVRSDSNNMGLGNSGGFGQWRGGTYKDTKNFESRTASQDFLMQALGFMELVLLERVCSGVDAGCLNTKLTLLETNPMLQTAASGVASTRVPGFDTPNNFGPTDVEEPTTGSSLFINSSSF